MLGKVGPIRSLAPTPQTLQLYEGGKDVCETSAIYSVVILESLLKVRVLQTYFPPNTFFRECR